MHGKAFLMALAASGCAAVPAASASGVTCRPVGEARAIAGLDGDACAIVLARVDAALAAAGGARTGVTIELDLSRPGSAIARIWRATHALPEVAVDVMDRELRREDLVRLADAVARAVSAPAD